MSARWRRSRKHQKWLDLKSLRITPKTDNKIMRFEKINPKKIHPQKYRLPTRILKGKYKEPKPLIDIFQEPNWITIVAELAGYTQETLKIHVKDQKIILSAKAKDRRYYKSLNLPKVVIPNIVRTNYKNGVLEIKLKKAIKQQTIKQAGINDAT